MNDQQPDHANETDAGVHMPLRRGPARKRLFGVTEAAALVLSVVWVLIASSTNENTEIGGVFYAVTLILPVMMIWVAALTLRALRDLRAESRELKVAVAAIRKSMITQQHSRVGQSPARPTEQRAEPRQIEKRAPAPVADPAPAQPDSQLTLPDFLRALNFPDSPDDQDGIRALRTALSDPVVAKLIRSAQDVLNLMAQDNIFMDELPTGSTDPALWRRFAAGERGGDIALLGIDADKDALEISADRMQTDAIYRDAVHHFMRQFDKTFVTFEQAATDAEVAQMAHTRTARAFTLLGNVTQIFG